MVLLTKKKQKELLCALTANAIIAEHYLQQAEDGKDKYDALDHLVENNVNIALALGGMPAVAAMDEMVQKKRRQLYGHL